MIMDSDESRGAAHRSLRPVVAIAGALVVAACFAIAYAFAAVTN